MADTRGADGAGTRDSTIVRAVAMARRHGLDVESGEELVDLGSVNHVVVVSSGEDRWVVRFAREPGNDGIFAAEQWCARRAAAAGVPTAQTIAIGVLDGLDHGIQEYVPGAPASGTEPADPEASWWATLGRYAAVIHRIEPDDDAPDALFSRFGRDLTEAWRQHLAYNLGCLTAGEDLLLSRGVYSADERRRLRDTVEALRDVPMRFGLSHGDLSPRNLLLPEPATGAAPVLIDWGCATFGPALHLDLVALERERANTGRPTAGEWELFLAAAGADRAEVDAVLPAFRLLQHHDLVRWAIDRCPERLEETVRSFRAVLDQSGGADGPIALA
ncbi:aminoglycoside phosphotransferase family protein [Salana multivorans]